MARRPARRCQPIVGYERLALMWRGRSAITEGARQCQGRAATCTCATSIFAADSREPQRAGSGGRRAIRERVRAVREGRIHPEIKISKAQAQARSGSSGARKQWHADCAV